MNVLKRDIYIPWWNIPKKVKHWLRMLKWAWQRITRGYADCDWWGMDSYLCSLLASMFICMRDNKIGHPLDMTAEEWGAYLEKMAQLFYQCDDSNDYYKNLAFEEMLTLDKNDQRRKELQEKSYEISIENYNKMEADKDQAFDMLKGRFFDLWD